MIFRDAFKLMATLAAFISFSILSVPIQAEGTDQTGAPYFQIVGAAAVEHLPLSSTDVQVSIAGVIADVSVRQVYENRGQQPIEAIYVFPGSSRAAVHAMSMTIGDRRVDADIRTIQQAQTEYKEARDRGQTAGLLENVHEGVFRMNLANILPGDRIEVHLQYTELLVPTDGVYDFHFPHTMGQRYSAGAAPVNAPTSSEAEVVDFAFSISARLASALPIRTVSSSSHDIEIEQPDAYTAAITLGEDALQHAGARDFHLGYRLAGDNIESGILLYPEGDGGYFLLMAEPPAQAREEWIPPREFVFVVDVSGSMHGEPLDISKRLVRELIGSLRAGDRFNLILFSGASKILSKGHSLPANEETTRLAVRMLDKAKAGDGTELVPALEQAYGLERDPAYARSVVVVTDGQIWADGEAFTAIRSHLGEANTFAFGIGPSVERSVIERLSRAGSADAFIVGHDDDAHVVATQLRQYIDRPLLSGINIGMDGFDGHDLEPQKQPDLLAKRPVVVIGRYRGVADGSVRISGRSGTEQVIQTLEVKAGNLSRDNIALSRLWARTRIQRLLDEQASGLWGNDRPETHAEEITALGLQYGLLTPYTAFVAVDRFVRADAPAVPVHQPAVARGGPDHTSMSNDVLEQSSESVNVAGSPVSGIGHAHPTGSLLNINLSASATAESPSDERQQVARYDLVLKNDVWTDVRYQPGQPLLRIRFDSAAYHALLERVPALRAVLDGATPMLVIVGSYAILVSSRGFSDFPDALLNAIAHQAKEQAGPAMRP